MKFWPHMLSADPVPDSVYNTNEWRIGGQEELNQPLSCNGFK